MLFSVVLIGESSNPSQFPCAFLHVDNWDDWFEYSTMYTLEIFLIDGSRIDVGSVKVGEFGMKPGQRRPAIDPRFEAIGEHFFSLGQDSSYYEQLNTLPTDLKQSVLEGLNDIAQNEHLLERALNEKVTEMSLLRSVSVSTIRHQYRRILRGEATLSPFHFSYQLPESAGGGIKGFAFSFDVKPESEPPSNVHVIIGTNGVGKTFLLNKMARAFVQAADGGSDDSGRFEMTAGDMDITSGVNAGLFAGAVSVSFSAFDQFTPLRSDIPSAGMPNYVYVGLRSEDVDGQMHRSKSPLELAAEFASSSGNCRIGAKTERWERALKGLESDPYFGRVSISRIARERWQDDDTRRAAMVALFDNLSSGHKLVLLTITRLVQEVEERTLVLLDEPEAHLHPPLLSAFIRALSDLLINRNGVAIVATHSPVVLQEVPASCVWKLNRTDTLTSADRPEIETFGENVGVLTREVFGLEVTESGFHKMLAHRAAASSDYYEAVGSFRDQLGGEARALLRALTVRHRSNGDI
jgi:predicted ATPase